MTEKKGIAVYCGSSGGNNPLYAVAAESVGNELARRGLPLVYGGGHMGLMGAVGRAVRTAGGVSVAVIPQFMVDRGWNDPDSTETIVTPSMHARKETMASLAQGVIALPGGIGTWEELSEIITWRQLGLYYGNIVVLNLLGYYDGFMRQFERAVAEGFFPSSHLELFSFVDNAVEAVERAAAKLSDSSIPPKF